MNKRIRIYIVILFCTLSFLPCIAQDFHKQADDVLKSSLPERHKIDSLYSIGFKNYYNDYQFGNQLGEKILNLSDKAKYPQGKGKAYILMALVEEGKGNLQMMHFRIKEALVLIPERPLTLDRARAVYCLGNYFRRKKRDKEAMEAFLESLRIAEAIDDKRMEAICYSIMGVMSVGQEEYGKALEYYEKSMRIALAAGDSVRIQRIYTNKGIVYMRQGQQEKSIRSHQEALKLAKQSNNKRDEAFVYNDLGAVHLLNDYDIPQAIRYLKKSIEIRKNLDEKNEISYTYNYLGQAYRQSGNQQEAVKWIKKAYHTAVQIGNNKQRYEAMDELSSTYHYFKINDSAYYYLRQHNIFRDSVRKAEQAEAIAELTIQYETEKKEQEIALLKQKTKIQQLDIRQRNLYLFIAALLVIGAAVTIWLVYRNRKIKEEKLKKEASMQAELLKMEARNTLQNDRLRISRDLHDNIGANLTFIHTNLTDIKPDNEHQNEQWNEVKIMLDETITELRRTVWLINKSSVSLEEWIVKLREYYRRIQKVIIVSETENHERIVSSKEATALFRIVQEAVNNALKHANPSEIKVQINLGNSGLTVCVTDNGKGFVFEKADGFGLGNMKQNAEEIGGTFRIESVFGKGTKIEVHIPKDTK